MRYLRNNVTFYRLRRRFVSRWLRYKPNRSAIPFATHIPVLVGLSKIIQPSLILELGCGEYSTPTFLNKETFPSLEKLDSIETDADWRSRILNMVDDQRLTIVMAEHTVSKALLKPETPLEQYDLVFVDDSITVEARASTIQTLATFTQIKGVIVIHDFQQPEYQQAASNFQRHYNCNALNPSTGIVWNQNNVKKRQLRQINRLIRKNCRKLQPDDIEGWTEVFTRI